MKTALFYYLIIGYSMNLVTAAYVGACVSEGFTMPRRNRYALIALTLFVPGWTVFLRGSRVARGFVKWLRAEDPDDE